MTGEQQGHIINGTKLFHFPKVQQEFTKKIGFSSLSLGGMFLADDPLIYCACPTVAHLVGSQHYGQNLIFVQIPYSREQKHVSISDTPMLLIEINSISNMGCH